MSREERWSSPAARRLALTMPTLCNTGAGGQVISYISTYVKVDCDSDNPSNCYCNSGSSGEGGGATTGTVISGSSC